MNSEEPSAEKVLLGCLLLDPEQLAPSLAAGLTPGDFAKKPHGAIFEAMVALYRQEQEIDVVLVAEHLESRGGLVAAGGYAYLDSLIVGIPKLNNVAYYLGIVKKRALIRGYAQLGREVIQRAEAGEEAEALHLALSRGLERFQAREMPAGTSLAGSFETAYGDICRRMTEPGTSYGLKSGIEALDDKTLGWHPGDLVVLAARPAMGKTALGVGLADRAGRAGNVLFFSYEMAVASLNLRWASQAGEINLMALRSAELNNRDKQQLDRLREGNKPLIHWVDQAKPTVPAIQNHVRRFLLQDTLCMIVVDHLHLMQAELHGGGRSNRNAEIGQITRGLKLLAKRFNVPVLLLCQLNRDLEKRKTNERRPQLSDLRDSGSIEQDADLVIFIHRPDYYGRDESGEKVEEPALQRGELIIAKHRNGPTGVVPVRYWRNYAKFADLQRSVLD